MKQVAVRRCLPILILLVSVARTFAAAAAPAPDTRLKGLDAYMEKIVKDWNVPGIGVGVVVKDRLVFAKGYGFRDYGRKLPFTPTTTIPIASNTIDPSGEYTFARK